MKISISQIFKSIKLWLIKFSILVLKNWACIDNSWILLLPIYILALGSSLLEEKLKFKFVLGAMIINFLILNFGVENKNNIFIINFKIFSWYTCFTAIISGVLNIKHISLNFSF